MIFRGAKRQERVRAGKTVLAGRRYSVLRDERTRLLVDEVLISENEIMHKRCPLNPSLPPPLLSSVERYSVSPCELPDDQNPYPDDSRSGMGEAIGRQLEPWSRHQRRSIAAVHQ